MKEKFSLSISSVKRRRAYVTIWQRYSSPQPFQPELCNMYILFAFPSCEHFFLWFLGGGRSEGRREEEGLAEPAL